MNPIIIKTNVLECDRGIFNPAVISVVYTSIERLVYNLSQNHFWPCPAKVLHIAIISVIYELFTCRRLAFLLL